MGNEQGLGAVPRVLWGACSVRKEACLTVGIRCGSGESRARGVRASCYMLHDQGALEDAASDFMLHCFGTLEG